MSWSEKALVWLLRFSGGLMLVALVAVFMPFDWMAAIHRWLGLGELPNTPIIGYLTRSLSALYAVHGALVVYLSFDVRRFLPVVRCLAVLSIAFGAGMLVLDCLVGLPLIWIASEGPFVVALGAAFLWLAGRIGREIDG